MLEVSQARQPCWRLNLRFERRDMARLVQATGRSGWYFRVIEPAEIAPRQTARLVARPHPIGAPTASCACSTVIG